MAQPGPWERFKDGVVMNALNNPLWGGAAFRLSNRLQGHSNAEINAELARRNAANAEKYKNAPVFQGAHGGSPHGLDYLSPENIGRGAVSLVSSLLGSVDPSYAIGGGATRIARVARQAAVQGGADAVRQGVNMAEGTQKGFDKQSPARAAALGMVFQGGHEALSSPAPKIIHDDDLHPDVIPDASLAPDGLPGNGSVRPIHPHELSRIMGDPEASGMTGINDNVPNRRMNNRDAFDDIQDSDLEALPPANREYVKQQLTQQPELTPAEAQEMDASAPKPNVPDTYGDVPYEAPPAAANDTHAPVSTGPSDDLYDELDRQLDAGEISGNEYDRRARELDRQGMSVPERETMNKLHPNENVIPIDEAEAPQGPLTSEGKVHGPFEEHPTDDPDGNKFLTYTAQDGSKLPIKMGIEPDGTAEIAIDQFGEGKNKLGPAEIRQAMYHLQDMYPEIKKFGGYRRSGAGKGRVQEVDVPSRNAPAEAPAEEAPDGNTPSIWADESGAFTPWGRKPKTKLEDIPDEDLTPEQRVQLGLRAAQPVRNAQEAAYRVERAKRFEAAKKSQYVNSGEAGFHQEKANLAGEMEKLPSPYSIRPKLEQTEVDSLFDQVRDHPALSYTDTVHARDGLQKLLANSGADVPTNSEMDALRKVFPEDPKAPKKSISSWISDVINAPRSIMASMDLSAPLRQGLPMIHRKEYWTAFGSMFKQIGEKGFDAVKQEIASRPSYHLMRDSGLALTDVDADLSQHEEKFLSNLATQIPVFGHVVKASERAYVGFLNKLRADTFDTLVSNARAAGKQLGDKEIKDISEYINTATGRGDLNGLVPKFLRGEEFDANKASPLLAGVLFSPRLMASRFQMLNPYYYYRLTPIARVEAAKSLAATVSFTTAALGLAHMAGLKVGYDPRSTDFGKIRVGKTTYDMTGGFASYVRLVAQGAYGERVNPNGSKTAMPDRVSTFGNFMRNKESPPLALVHSLMKGVDNNFDKVDLKNHKTQIAEDIGKDFVPLVAQDTYGVYKSDGAKQAAISAVPDLFGVGVNSYEPKKKGSRTTKFKDFGTGGFGGGFKGGF